MWKRLSSRSLRISRNALLIRAVVLLLVLVSRVLARWMWARVRVLQVVWGRIAVKELWCGYLRWACSCFELHL